ncbi:MAG: hypothetical protein RMJ46_03430 [Bacteroidota bacterium]|nr:hypothetical protein [Bacteroidota bacterium]
MAVEPLGVWQAGSRCVGLGRGQVLTLPLPDEYVQRLGVRMPWAEGMLRLRYRG